MERIRIRDGYDGDIVGTIFRDGHIETDDDSLTTHFEVLHSDSGMVAACRPGTNDEKRTVSTAFSPGDEGYLCAVADAIGEGYVCETPDGEPVPAPEILDS
jgi:hypothetical protein